MVAFFMGGICVQNPKPKTQNPKPKTQNTGAATRNTLKQAGHGLETGAVDNLAP